MASSSRWIGICPAPVRTYLSWMIQSAYRIIAIIKWAAVRIFFSSLSRNWTTFIANLPALFHFASEHNATTHAQLFTNPRTPNRAATANLSLISFPYHTKLKCGPRYAPVFSIKYTQPKHPLFQSGHVRAPCWAIREYASELRCDTPEPQSAGPIPIQRCICFLFYNFVLNAQYYYQIHAKWPKNSIFKF